MKANALGVGYIQLTGEEYEQHKDTACHTNLAAGLNIFTPLQTPQGAKTLDRAAQYGSPT